MVSVTPARCFWGLRGMLSQAGPRLLCTGGQEAWYRLGHPQEREAAAFAGCLRARAPQTAGLSYCCVDACVGVRTSGHAGGGRVPPVRHIISQAPSGIRAERAAPAPVIGAPLFPARLAD